jgi:hypothetical protein
LIISSSNVEAVNKNGVKITIRSLAEWLLET